VHAFPLLKKYNMKATIFVATDFIDPSEACRPNLEDVWSGRVSKNSMQWWGHLSWPELSKMYESGLIDVQSHTQTHTWYFTGDSIVDFHHPGDGYVWLFWNAHPTRKYSWLTQEFHDAVPWGTPVYAFDRVLLKKRYDGDPRLTEEVINHVAHNGQKAFFDNPMWKDELLKVIGAYRSTHASQGYYETDEDYLGRVKAELDQSKKTIEARLNKTVNFCCWPFGDFTETIHRIAIEESGYLSAVTTKDTGNRFGGDPTRIGRKYFWQNCKGPGRASLIFLSFWGTVHYQRGSPVAYVILPLCNRLVRLSKYLQKQGR
jgi:hypothetical protein